VEIQSKENTSGQQHREELLEAEIRRLRQALRILSDAVILGSSQEDLDDLAFQCQRLLDGAMNNGQ